MEIPKDKKIDILINALDERYRSIHIIRERVQTVSIWILGILIGATGWLFQSNVCFSIYQKTFTILILLVLWATLRWFYFMDLQKGFNSQRKVVAKLERGLGFYKKTFYDDTGESIYPKEWEKSGQKGSEGRFFDNTYNLLAIGFGIFILTILLFS